GNHHHVIARDNAGNMPEFLCHLHAMLAKAINAHRGRWENFFATEQVNVVHLVEAEDRFEKLIYLLTNPVSDHLVDRVGDWPCASTFSQNRSGSAKTIARPRGYFRKNGKMPEMATLRIERPEGFEHLSDEEWQCKVLTAVHEEEERAREERRASGRGVLG